MYVYTYMHVHVCACEYSVQHHRLRAPTQLIVESNSLLYSLPHHNTQHNILF